MKEVNSNVQCSILKLPLTLCANIIYVDLPPPSTISF